MFVYVTLSVCLLNYFVTYQCRITALSHDFFIIFKFVLT